MNYPKNKYPSGETQPITKDDWTSKVYGTIPMCKVKQGWGFQQKSLKGILSEREAQISVRFAGIDGENSISSWWQMSV